MGIGWSARTRGRCKILAELGLWLETGTLNQETRDNHKVNCSDNTGIFSLITFFLERREVTTILRLLTVISKTS